jgi:hypothetical protein
MRMVCGDVRCAGASLVPAHAVAYGSYEGGLSELVHRLPFNGVVARTLKLASNYAEFRLAGYGHPAGENEQREDVLVTTAMS